MIEVSMLVDGKWRRVDHVTHLRAADAVIDEYRKKHPGATFKILDSDGEERTVLP